MKVEDYLNQINYKEDKEYIPSTFALEFVNFMKLVNSNSPEKNKTPIMHYKIIDTFQGKNQNVINMCARGTAKTTILEHLILYLAVYGSIPNYGDVSYCLFIGDNETNGVKKMRLRLENRWNKSEFLQTFLPEKKKRLTDVRWYFENVDGRPFVCTGHGAQQGVRGTVELGTRPQLALLDDLIKDAAATSAAMIEAIENTVKKAVRQALDPQLRKVVWCGTPFNARDPFYKAAESGAWKVNAFPICEEFPVKKKEFHGAWEDRFDFDMIKAEYDFALQEGSIAAFNQELMLRIMSDEDRLITDSDIRWYKREDILKNKNIFNFYITSDLATKEKESNDFSVVSVWAYNANGEWFYVDGICKKQTMDKTINDIFRLAQMYHPQSVGIETNGQQYAFISWLQSEMMNRNIWFNFASNSAEPGIKSTGNKFERFLMVSPWFKAHRFFFPEELKLDDTLIEGMNELRLVSVGGFKSKHDDFCDSISQLAFITAWKPSEAVPLVENKELNIWQFAIEDVKDYNQSYFV